jgi:hypothetical protein
MTDAAKELDAMADAFEHDRRSLLNLAAFESSSRRSLRESSAVNASAVYESELRIKAATLADCVRRLREQAETLRLDEVAD